MTAHKKNRKSTVNHTFKRPHPKEPHKASSGRDRETAIKQLASPIYQCYREQGVYVNQEPPHYAVRDQKITIDYMAHNSTTEGLYAPQICHFTNFQPPSLLDDQRYSKSPHKPDG